MRETKVGGLSGIRCTANQEDSERWRGCAARLLFEFAESRTEQRSRNQRLSGSPSIRQKAGRQFLALVSPERLPKSRNFLRPFLDLVASGVAVTS